MFSLYIFIFITLKTILVHFIPINITFETSFINFLKLKINLKHV
jgi:hypothetical protein